MRSYKSDFPIFANHPGLIYLDNGATTQKPTRVIDGVARYLSHDNANIHRGMYILSESSEVLYMASKEATARHIGARFPSEIIYTYNANYAANLLAHSLALSGMIKRGDTVLVCIAEHHANVVPWLILQETMGIQVKYFHLTDSYDIDMDDFMGQYDDTVRIVSTTMVSNVLGSVFDLTPIKKALRDDTFFVVDLSQAVPHFAVDVSALGCDFAFFSAHKIMADTGLGVLYGKKELLRAMRSAFSGGGAISIVTEDHFDPAGLPDRFEIGTPNIVGAVSLLEAWNYIDSIGGYDTLTQHEAMITRQMCDGFAQLGDRVRLFGKTVSDNRLGVFSFEVPGKHPTDIGEAMNRANICIRAGFHCAEPLARHASYETGTIRASSYLYNDLDDIDTFFSVLSDSLR